MLRNRQAFIGWKTVVMIVLILFLVLHVSSLISSKGLLIKQNDGLTPYTISPDISFGTFLGGAYEDYGYSIVVVPDGSC